MSGILDDLREWREHHARIASADAEVERLRAVAAQAEAEHVRAVEEFEDAAAAALAAGQVPPPRPPERDGTAAAALAAAMRTAAHVRSRSAAVLASCADVLEELVRERAASRTAEARGLVARLDTLAEEQDADQKILANARTNREPGVTPSWAERTHRAEDVSTYLEGIRRGVDWATAIPLAALGIAPREPVDPDDQYQPWHQSRAGQAMAGPEYARLRGLNRPYSGRGVEI